MKDVIHISTTAAVKRENFSYRIISDRRIIGFISSKLNGKLFECICYLQLHCHVKYTSVYTIQNSFIRDFHILIVNIFSTIIFNLTNRLLDEFSVAVVDFSWKSHLSEIFHTIRNKLGIRPCLHPCDHHTSAIRCLHALWSIEINSAVEWLHIFSDKLMCLFVIGSCQINNTVTYMELQSFRHHCHRAYDQNMLAVYFIEIRTFPHFSKFFITVVKYAYILPLECICTFEEKDSTVSIVRHICNNCIIKSILIFPDLRIAEVDFTSSCRNIFSGNDRILFIFLVIRSITHCQTLCLMCWKFSIGHRNITYISNSGIHQKMSTIRKLNTTSGETSEIIIGFFRNHGKRESLPGDKIFTCHMTPVHRSPFIRIRMILIKQMIFVFIKGKSIWIIDPSGTTSHMIAGAFFRRNSF